MNNICDLKKPAHYPAEWELDGRILIAWPHKHTDWNYCLDDAVDQFRKLTMAFVDNGERVIIVGPHREDIKNGLEGISLENVEIVEVPTNDTWTRDYGPIMVDRHGRRRAFDFGFNGWGLKFAADKDNLVNLALNDDKVMPVGMYRNCREFTLEGGSIETDGQGTLLTTSRCLLSPNRNGGGTKAEIGERLSEYLGVDHILWLDYGALIGDDTDSHVDTLCRLAPGNTILFTGTHDVDDPQFEDLLHMRAQLSLFRNAEGEPYNLVELPLPSAIFDEDGERLPATYANYLVTKKGVYMPTYGQPEHDRLACEMVKVAFHDLPVIPVDCRVLIRQHGSLHCSTMMVEI